MKSRYAARQPSNLFHPTQGFASLTLGFYVSALRAFAAARLVFPYDIP